MKMKTYIFDSAAVSVRKFTRSAWTVLSTVLRLVLVSLALFIALYLVFSLFISTDTEKNLRRENKLYEKAFADIEGNVELVVLPVRNSSPSPSTYSSGRTGASTRRSSIPMPPTPIPWARWTSFSERIPSPTGR